MSPSIPGLGSSSTVPNGESDSPDGPESIDDLDPREIDTKRRKAKRGFEKADEEIQRLKEKHKKTLREGAECSDSRRKVLAMRARIIRFKGNLKEIKRMKDLRDWMTYTQIKGHIEVSDMAEKELSDLGVLDEFDLDVTDVNAMISDTVANIKSDMAELGESMEEMSHAVSSGGLSERKFPEEETMERIAKGQTDADAAELEFDPDVDVDSILSEVPDGSLETDGARL